MPTYNDLGYARGGAFASDDTRTVFGQVMGLVAVSLGFAALGAYVLRNQSGGTGILMLIPILACSFGLQAAAAALRR